MVLNCQAITYLPRLIFFLALRKTEQIVQTVINTEKLKKPGIIFLKKGSDSKNIREYI